MAAAKTIVVRATGPSSAAYPAGKVLPDNGSVTLQANDVLVILDAKGTRTLKGAGKHAIAASTQSASNAQSSFQRLLLASGGRPSRGGVSRDPTGGLTDDGQPSRSPNLWFVDVRKSGTVCVADPANLKLWRAQMEGDGVATIARTGDGKAGTVTFISGSMVKAWPIKQMPVTDGATYSLRMGQAAPVTIRFAVIPAAAGGPSLEETASTLAAHGCTAQLDLLADALSGPSAS